MPGEGGGEIPAGSNAGQAADQGGQVGAGAAGAVMAAVVDGGVTGHVGGAAGRELGHPEGTRGGVDRHALAAGAAALVPIIGHDRIVAHVPALVLGAGRGALGLDRRGAKTQDRHEKNNRNGLENSVLQGIFTFPGANPKTFFCLGRRYGLVHKE